MNKKKYNTGGQINTSDALSLVNNFIPQNTETTDITDNVMRNTMLAAKAGSVIPGIGTLGAGLIGGVATLGYNALKQNNVFAEGGELVEFEGGGTHEENPNGGIPLGKGNLVEENETMAKFNATDYVFSDRLKIPGSKKSFADESKLIKSKVNKDRPNDKASKRTVERLLAKLADKQEELKAKKEALLKNKLGELQGLGLPQANQMPQNNMMPQQEMSAEEMMYYGGQVKMGDGGKVSDSILYVDPNDPAGRARYKAYNDSLALYNVGQEKLKFWRNNPTATNVELNKNQSEIDRNFDYYGAHARLGYPNIIDMVPIGAGDALRNIPLYKKPVERVKYKPNPEIADKQQQLIDAGYNIGKADGVWGKKSEAAWQDLQNKKQSEPVKTPAETLPQKQETTKVKMPTEPYIKYSQDAPGPAKYWYVNPQKGTTTPINKNVATTTYKNLEVVNTPYKNKKEMNYYGGQIGLPKIKILGEGGPPDILEALLNSEDNNLNNTFDVTATSEILPSTFKKGLTSVPVTEKTYIPTKESLYSNLETKNYLKQPSFLENSTIPQVDDKNNPIDPETGKPLVLKNGKYEVDNTGTEEDYNLRPAYDPYLAAAGTLANIAPSIYNISRGLKKPAEINLQRPQLSKIDLSLQRELIKRQAADTNALNQQNVRNLASSSGSALAGSISSLSSLNKAATNAIAESKLTEDVQNVGITNQQAIANATIANQEQDMRWRTDATKQSILEAGLTGVGAGFASGIKDFRAGAANDRYNERVLKILETANRKYNPTTGKTEFKS